MLQRACRKTCGARRSCLERLPVAREKRRMLLSRVFCVATKNVRYARHALNKYPGGSRFRDRADNCRGHKQSASRNDLFFERKNFPCLMISASLDCYRYVVYSSYLRRYLLKFLDIMWFLRLPDAQVSMDHTPLRRPRK